jgi:hypothetical protein
MLHQQVLNKVSISAQLEVSLLNNILLGSKQTNKKSKVKLQIEPNSKPISSRNENVRNLKAYLMDNSSEIPTVEFDFSNSNIKHGPPT